MDLQNRRWQGGKDSEDRTVNAEAKIFRANGGLSVLNSGITVEQRDIGLTREVNYCKIPDWKEVIHRKVFCPRHGYN